MIRLSRRTELIYPVRTMLFYAAQVIAYVAVVVALGWGWGQWRFSPLERYYFFDYANASLGAVAGSAPGHVKWLEKRGPDREWQIADPGDLVPVKTGPAPFALTDAARAEGWTELGYSTGGTTPERQTRDYLQATVFDGHSFWTLALQPLEFLFAGWLCWKIFDLWRDAEARKRGAGWNPHYRPNPVLFDLWLFLRFLAREVGKGVALCRQWVMPKRKVAHQTVAQAGAPTPQKSSQQSVVSKTPIATSSAPAIRPTPVQKGGRSEAQASPPAQSAPQESPASPFGKPITEGAPDTKWDISKWID